MNVTGVHPVQARNARLAVLLGLVALAVGTWYTLSAIRFMAKSVPTTGVIVSRGGSTFTVRFELNGRSAQFESEMPTTKGLARSCVQVGREVEVRYNPDAPGEARVAGSKLWTFPLAMLVIGVLAVSSGLAKMRI